MLIKKKISFFTTLVFVLVGCTTTGTQPVLPTIEQITVTVTNVPTSTVESTQTVEPTPTKEKIEMSADVAQLCESIRKQMAEGIRSDNSVNDEYYEYLGQNNEELFRTIQYALDLWSDKGIPIDWSACTNGRPVLLQAGFLDGHKFNVGGTITNIGQLTVLSGKLVMLMPDPVSLTYKDLFVEADYDESFKFANNYPGAIVLSNSGKIDPENVLGRIDQTDGEFINIIPTNEEGFKLKKLKGLRLPSQVYYLLVIPEGYSYSEAVNLLYSLGSLYTEGFALEDPLPIYPESFAD